MKVPEPGCEGNPLESEIPWALPARNKAGRAGEDQTVERVRNPRDGAFVDWQTMDGFAGVYASKGRRTP
jgi:hypothetical protein